MYKISKEQLYNDLLIAFFDARKHKSSKKYVKEFESNLDKNIRNLRDEIYNRTYIPGRFTAFIILKPKPREIYASEFRDRIVHHLYFNYLHKHFENIFINDSYSCIKNKGTSYGIKRLEHHIRSESLNYTVDCFYMKIDIRSYFISINKNILFNIVVKHLDRFKERGISLDYDLLKFLTKQIIYSDASNVNIKGKHLWNNIDKSKCVYYAKPDCALPIGNLTSQLFSNIYMNEFDHFVKRVLHYKHYGRYVDDAFFISRDKNKLVSDLPKIESFLKSVLDLDIHKGKTLIKNAKYGIEFLGAYIKPFRIYASNQTIRRMKSNIYSGKNKLESKISRLGLLKQYKTFNLIYKQYD